MHVNIQREYKTPGQTNPSGSKIMEVYLPQIEQLKPQMEVVSNEKLVIDIKSQIGMQISDLMSDDYFGRYRTSKLNQVTVDKKGHLLDKDGNILQKNAVFERDYFPDFVGLDKDYYIPNFKTKTKIEKDAKYGYLEDVFKKIMDTRVAFMMAQQQRMDFDRMKEVASSHLNDMRSIMAAGKDVNNVNAANAFKTQFIQRHGIDNALYEMNADNCDYDVLFAAVEEELNVIRKEIRHTQTYDELMRTHGGNYWLTNYSTPVKGYKQVPGKTGVDAYQPVYDEHASITSFNISISEQDIARATAYLAQQGEMLSREEVLERFRDVIRDFSGQQKPVTGSENFKLIKVARSVGDLTFARPFMISDVQTDGSAVVPHVQLEISNMCVSKDPLLGLPVYTWITADEIKKDMENRLPSMLNKVLGLDTRDVEFTNANAIAEQQINKQIQGVAQQQQQVMAQYLGDESVDTSIPSDEGVPAPDNVRRNMKQKLEDNGVAINGDRYAEVIKGVNDKDIVGLQRVVENVSKSQESELAELMAQVAIKQEQLNKTNQTLQQINEIPGLMLKLKSAEKLVESFQRDELLLATARLNFEDIKASGLVTPEALEAERLRITEELQAALPEAVEGEPAPQIDMRMVDARLYVFAHKQFKSLANEGRSIVSVIERLADKDFLTPEQKENFQTLTTSLDRVECFVESMVEQQERLTMELGEVTSLLNDVQKERNTLSLDIEQVNEALASLDADELGIDDNDLTGIIDTDNPLSERIGTLTEILADKHQHEQELVAENDKVKAEKQEVEESLQHVNTQIDAIKVGVQNILNDENEKDEKRIEENKSKIALIAAAPRDDVGNVIKEVFAQERARAVLAEQDLEEAAKHVGNFIGKEVSPKGIELAVTTAKLRIQQNSDAAKQATKELATVTNNFETLATKFEEVESEKNALESRLANIEALAKQLSGMLDIKGQSIEEVLQHLNQAANETREEHESEKTQKTQASSQNVDAPEATMSDIQRETLRNAGLLDELGDYEKNKATQMPQVAPKAPQKDDVDDDEPGHNR